MDIWTALHTHIPALVLPGTAHAGEDPVTWLRFLHSLAQPNLLDQLFRVLLAVAAIVFLAVEGVLVYAVFRSRRAEKGPSEATISPRPGLEILWTLIPAILVIVIAVFSFRALAAQPPVGPGGDNSAPAQDTVEAGRIVFTTYGCSTCHTLKAARAVGTVGPDLDGVGSWAGSVVAGMDADAFLHQAVLDPEAHIAAGYQKGIMPTNFATRLSPAQVSGLMAFLMVQK